MPIPTLADLITPSTESQILAMELAVAQQEGLPITSWNPLDPSRTIFQINANIASMYSADVALLAQGGYASLAAQMVDSSGNPITSWMDLIGNENYNTPRFPATAAAGLVPLVNSGGSAYPFSPNSPLHFQNSVTGATYTSVGSGTVAASSTTQVSVQADAPFIGQIGTSATGVVLVLLTPLTNVTVGALAASLVGANAETNAHYLARCQAKLGSISPNGNSQAYVYVAESIPVLNTTLSDGTLFSAPVAAHPYGVKQPISRVTTALVIGSGVLNVYLANAQGGLSGCAQMAITNVTSTGSAPNFVVTVTTAVNHGLNIGDWAIISGVKGATIVNNSVSGTVAWQLTAAFGNTFSFNLTASSFGAAYTSGGLVDGGDLGMADAAIQAIAVPDGYTTFSVSASNAVIPITATVYISARAGIGGSSATVNIQNALANYFASVPIGGVNAEANNILPWSDVLTTISNANPGTVSVILSVPSGDTTLAVNQVPVLGTSNITVIFV